MSSVRHSLFSLIYVTSIPHPSISVRLFFQRHAVLFNQRETRASGLLDKTRILALFLQPSHPLPRIIHLSYPRVSVLPKVEGYHSKFIFLRMSLYLGSLRILSNRGSTLINLILVSLASYAFSKKTKPWSMFPIKK